MEAGWSNLFSGGDAGAGSADSRGQNTNFTNTWEASVIDALLFGANNNATLQVAGVEPISIHRSMPDRHMMCLKLGKRHYCEDTVVPDRHPESSTTTKIDKPPYPYYMTGTTTVTSTTTTCWPASPGVRVTSSPALAAVPRCQVEGCRVALGNAKEYYRKHKVCEIHSKAPKVVLLGLQQRFCQQCSRFHGVAEFDEAKRSCRRRLKGHNQRRRKGTPFHWNFPHPHENRAVRERQHGPLPPSPTPSLLKPGCALSFLSSLETEPWNSSSELWSRSSAAFCELMAANRSSSVLGHLLNQNNGDEPVSDDTNTMHRLSDTQMSTWDATNTTLAPALELGVLDKSKEPEEWSDYCWWGAKS